MKTNKYSDEELLDILRGYGKEFGLRKLHKSILESKRLPIPQTYRNRFGSWKNALILAGLPNLSAWRIDSNINKLSDMDAKYIAGLLDCEGCISRSRRNSHSYSLNFVNTNKEIVDLFRDIVNGGRINYCNGTYRLEFRKNEVIELLPQIYPYLIVKRKEADNLIEYIRKEQTELDFDDAFIPLYLEENIKKYNKTPL
ncbi:hypothetical protein KKH23_07925 [Patescibacteria group bacterium]|nr:hypothetical protein [Patescibacteria group bacterium]